MPRSLRRAGPGQHRCQRGVVQARHAPVLFGYRATWSCGRCVCAGTSAAIEIWRSRRSPSGAEGATGAGQPPFDTPEALLPAADRLARRRVFRSTTSTGLPDRRRRALRPVPHRALTRRRAWLDRARLAGGLFESGGRATSRRSPGAETRSGRAETIEPAGRAEWGQGWSTTFVQPSVLLVEHLVAFDAARSRGRRCEMIEARSYRPLRTAGSAPSSSERTGQRPIR